MKKTVINSFAKINISLDICGVREDGYHEVETVMQMLDFSDEVLVRWYPYEKREDMLSSSDMLEDIEIEVSTNRPYLPTDENNLAWKAARTMIDLYKEGKTGGKVRIDIKKRIPVAAGLAGGSGNAAAVIVALNKLWKLDLDARKMCEIAAPLGADVPFCVMGIVKGNASLGVKMNKDPFAATAAIGKGTGTDLVPVKSLKAYVVLVKPPVKVSTRDVYAHIDEEIEAAKKENLQLKHSDSDVITKAMAESDFLRLGEEMANLLELYTIKKYPELALIKSTLRANGNPVKVMMSGSGPSIFGIYKDRNAAMKGFEALKKKYKLTFLLETI